jgi:uncharacterized protein (DUF1501 family)
LIKSAAVAAAASGPSWLPKVALAGTEKAKRDVIVSVYLRGGIDGLTMCIPYFEPNYYNLRPNIAVPRPDSSSPNKVIPLDNRFGLPPGLSALLEPYQAGWLMFAHAVGAPNWSRSHFDAQRWMEVGSRDQQTMTSGWLARHLMTVGPMKANAILRGLSMTYGMRQTMNGAPKALPIPDPSNFGYAGWWYYESEIAGYIKRGYDRVDGELFAAANDTRQTIDLLKTIDFNGYSPAGGATYPDTEFGKSLKASAALMKADVGVEAIHVDLDGWDTHSDMGPVDGYMNEHMQNLGNSLRAFWKDLSSSNRANWTMLVMSEFGRNVRENSSRGNDHGYANAMMVMGGAVNGGKVMTNWPGLHEDQLFEGADLAATIDHRDIVAEVLKVRAGNTQLNKVFPGYNPKLRGVVRPFR